MFIALRRGVPLFVLLLLMPALAGAQQKRLTIDDLYWMGNPKDGYIASIRWSAQGTHRGNGIYGEPTGRQAPLWGISQWAIEDGMVVKEWAMFNEFGILMQLAR